MKSSKFNNKILDYWFSHENVWFNSTTRDDDYIISNFYNYLDEYQNFNKSKCNIIESTPYGLLSKIILYDQMTRHFYRHEEDKWKIYTKLAIDLVYIGLSKNFDKNFNVAEKCFFILPLRHSDNIYDMYIARDKVLKYIKYENNSMYNRFYYHTIKKIALNINASIMYDMKSTAIIKDTYIKYLPDCIIYYQAIDKRNKQWFNFINNIYNFQESLLIQENKILYYIHAFITKYNIVDLCVSLSGGVDSMILLASFIKLRNIGVIKSVNAFHINYGNKINSWFEREYVIRFCKYHNVELIVRDINEIKRTKEFREIYEDVTRIIRFDMYKKINKPIFLGHNYEDCVENMITNIKKKKHYDNLYNMTEICTIDNVILCRPLLNYDKTDIFNYAIKLNINHTRNSTPKWSDRGKIRNELIPVVEKIQPGFMCGLINIKNILQESYKEINRIAEYIITNINITEKQNLLIIKLQRYDGAFLYEIWKKIIIKICNKYNIYVPSNKSINNFISNIKNIRRINLSKILYASPNDQNIIFYHIQKSSDEHIQKR